MAHFNTCLGTLCLALINSHKYSKVELGLDTEQWNNVSSMSVSCTIYSVQHYSQGILLETVHFGSSCAVKIHAFVEIWSTCHSRVRTCCTQQSTIFYWRHWWLQEWHNTTIWIQVDNVEWGTQLSTWSRFIKYGIGILQGQLVLIRWQVVQFEVILHQLMRCLWNIISIHLIDSLQFLNKPDGSETTGWQCVNYVDSFECLFIFFSFCLEYVDVLLHHHDGQISVEDLDGIVEDFILDKLILLVFANVFGVDFGLALLEQF